MPTGEHAGDTDIAVSDMSNLFVKSIHTFSLRLSQGLTSRGPEQPPVTGFYLSDFERRSESSLPGVLAGMFSTLEE